MSVLEAYWWLPEEEPGEEIEVAQPGFRTLDVTEIIDGELVRLPFVVRCVPQCVTCNLPDNDRYHVERGVLRQRSYPAILSALPEDSPIWFKRNGERRTPEAARLLLSDHVCNGHSELEATATRALLEGFAISAAVDLAGSNQTIITDVGLLKEFQRRGFEHMMECGTAPSVRDTIKVTEILMAHQEVAGDSHVQVAAEAIQAFMRVLTQQLDPDTMQWAIAALDAEPKVQALLRTAYESQVAGG